jgi:succinyl-CoA synthetase alpha subunit
MAVLVDKKSRVIVQGFTGSEGTFHATQMIEYGTNVVGGVTPGKGGSTHLGKPVFNTVTEAVSKAGANVTIIFVPPAFAADAIMEAAEAGIKVIVCITEGIPVKDMIKVKDYIKSRACTLIGPNCPGVITPGQAKVGIMPGFVFKPGKVGIVSKSGTLTYEAADQIVKAGLGVSTAIGIGGDPIIGTPTKEAVELLMNDPQTEAIVMIGEIGGNYEALAGKWIKQHGTKPVVGFIAGQTAPAGRRMGHAGAIVGGHDDTAAAKMRILRECGVTVVESPAKIGEAMAELLKKIKTKAAPKKPAKPAKKASKTAAKNKAKSATKKKASKPAKKTGKPVAKKKAAKKPAKKAAKPLAKKKSVKKSSSKKRK